MEKKCSKKRDRLTTGVPNLLRSQDGSGLLYVIVGAAVGLMLILYLSQRMSNYAKTLSQDDLQIAFDAVKVTIKNGISCHQTFDSLDMPNDCNPANPTPIMLKWPDGTDVTLPLRVTGALQNSGRLFKPWYLLTTCDNVKKTLEIRLAKVRSSGTFYKSRVSGQNLDFTSRGNPIFGKDGDASTNLCEDMFGVASGSGGTNIVQESAPLAYTGRPECEDLQHDDDAGYYAASIECPMGTAVVGGGVHCAYPGFMALSAANISTNRWEGACCGSDNAGIRATWGKVFVLCR